MWFTSLRWKQRHFSLNILYNYELFSILTEEVWIMSCFYHVINWKRSLTFSLFFLDAKLASREKGKFCFKAIRCKEKEGKFTLFHTFLMVIFYFMPVIWLISFPLFFSCCTVLRKIHLCRYHLWKWTGNANKHSSVWF